MRTNARKIAKRAALAFSAAAMAFYAVAATGQAVPQQTLRSVGTLVTQRGSEKVALGSAFFVEVPSRNFAGNSFVYLVTAHHLLLDRDGNPIPKLAVVLEDSATGTSFESPLPDENHWIIDPKRESADIAALPLSPPRASISPIPITMLFAEESEARVGTLPASVDVGAQCYYLSAAALGSGKGRFVPLTRFCHVSTNEAAEATVAGAGKQQLYFVDASGGSDLSGAPVFAQSGDRYVLFGMMETRGSAGADSALAGLSGVLPAGYIAETVDAMAEAQERAAKAKSIGK